VLIVFEVQVFSVKNLNLELCFECGLLKNLIVEFKPNLTGFQNLSGLISDVI